MDGRGRKGRYQAWIAVFCVAAVAWICAALAQSVPQTVNIQLVAFVRPGTAIGTVFFFDSGVAIGSAPEHGGVVRIVLPMTLGTHHLQAQFVSSAALYGDSQSQVENYTVDPSNPVVMFGLYE